MTLNSLPVPPDKDDFGGGTRDEQRVRRRGIDQSGSNNRHASDRVRETVCYRAVHDETT